MLIAEASLHTCRLCNGIITGKQNTGRGLVAADTNYFNFIDLIHIGSIKYRNQVLMYQYRLFRLSSTLLLYF